MSFTPVSVIWSLLSFLVAASCWFSLLQPYWFLVPETLTSLGIFRYCHTGFESHTINQEPHLLLTSDSASHSQSEQFVVVSKGGAFQCEIYGRHFHFSNLPSGAWQAACVMLTSGCFLMSVGAVFTIGTLLISDKRDKKLASFTGYVQMLAATLFTGGLVIFPAGLDSTFVQQFCKGSQMYRSGTCFVGWAYILGIVADALALFCPFLSRHFNTIIAR